ncbi:CHAD domain-containing protein [Ralstonia condita]|uniref:CHAD domain-containing protein n=1 Tax=Ralstonia condita TaxID=3058600 RepID=UPI00292FB989|nr:CHAD domain-containing protein [Ralstonia sp. LMG 7141]
MCARHRLEKEAPLSGEGNPVRASAPRLHRARIAAKQWRYLYEAFYPALGAWTSRQYGAHLGKLQDALGEIHDAGVSLQRGTGLLEHAPPAAILSVFHMRERTERKRPAKSLRWIRRHQAI